MRATFFLKKNTPHMGETSARRVSAGIARALAMVNGYELNPTAEIRGLGIANILGACFNCYTTTGSFSRSSLQQSTGAKSQLSGFTTAICMMLVLLWLTPLFEYRPGRPHDIELTFKFFE